jgi:hypothetical protein
VNAALRRVLKKPLRVTRVAERGYDNALPVGRKAVPHSELVRRYSPIVGQVLTGAADLNDPAVMDMFGTVMQHYYDQLRRRST